MELRRRLAGVRGYVHLVVRAFFAGLGFAVATVLLGGLLERPAEIAAAEPTRVEVTLHRADAPEATDQEVLPAPCRCPESEGEEGALTGGSCDAPFLGADWQEGLDGDGDHDLVGAAASRGAFGVVAAWSRHRLLVSRDDGRSFEVLDRSAHFLRDVAVGRAGTVFAIWGSELRVYPATGGRQSHPLPCSVGPDDLMDYGSFVATSGGYVIAVLSCESSDNVIALSRDRGVSWRTQPQPDVVESSPRVRVRPGGAIDLVAEFPDCRGEYVAHFRGHVRGGAWQEPTVLMGYHWGLGHGGTMYELGHGWDDGGEAPCLPADALGICSVTPSGARRGVVAGLAEELLEASFGVAHNDRSTLAVVGRQLFRLERRRHEVLAREVPEGLESLSVDSCGRLVALDRGRVVRWAQGTGFRILRGAEAALVRP